MTQKKFIKQLAAFLFSASVVFSSSENTSAAEKKSIFNLKLIILNKGQYEKAYDYNSNGTVNVFDIIRLKQEQYNLNSNDEPVTTTVTTTVTEPVTTTVTTTVTEPVTTPITEPITTTMQTKKIISSVKSFVQGPELPTGCEATGLTIAVRWYGYDIDKVTMAMKYMPRQEFRYSNGRLIGADFITTFAGNPQESGMSYGCYIPCMITTVNKYFQDVGSSYRGKNLTGTELEDLFPYVAQNKPVILISTPELVTPQKGDSWYTEDGRYVTWQRGHHCMVLMGYDKEKSLVYCADPMMRKGIVEYDFDKFKNIYNLKGKNAMIIDTGSVEVPKRTCVVGETIRYVGYIHSASDGSGSSYYVDSNVYTVTAILQDTTLPYRVCIGNLGWVSYDALYENIPYYGSGNDNGTEPVSGTIYNLKNASSSKYLNVDYGIDSDGTNIYQWSSDGSTEQKFKLVADGDAFKLFSMSSSSGTNRVVSASDTVDGANVNLWSQTNSITQQWLLKKVKDNAYCIVLKAYPGYALTVYGSSNGSKSGTSETSSGNVFIKKYTGDSSQLWYFE